jgi:hypothetical protein
MTRDTAKHEPKVATYTEYRHGGRYLHVKGPDKEARELVRIAVEANPGAAVIEDFRYPTTGMSEFIIKLAEVQ